MGGDSGGRSHTKYVLEAVFYCTNFFLAYRAQFSPIEHLWSLAEEEQFYFVWPLVLIALLRFRARWVVGLFLSALLALLVWNEVRLTHDGVSGLRLTYGVDTRSDGLVVGCLLAVCWNRLPAKLAGWLALAGAPFAGYLVLTGSRGLNAASRKAGASSPIWFALIIRLATADGIFARVVGWGIRGHVSR